MGAQVEWREYAAALQSSPEPCAGCGRLHGLLAEHSSGQGNGWCAHCVWCDPLDWRVAGLLALWHEGRWLTPDTTEETVITSTYIAQYVAAFAEQEPDLPAPTLEQALHLWRASGQPGTGGYWPVWYLMMTNPKLSAGDADRYLRAMPGAGWRDRAAEVPGLDELAPAVVRLRAAVAELGQLLTQAPGFPGSFPWRPLEPYRLKSGDTVDTSWQIHPTLRWRPPEGEPWIVYDIDEQGELHLASTLRRGQVEEPTSLAAWLTEHDPLLVCGVEQALGSHYCYGIGQSRDQQSALSGLRVVGEAADRLRAVLIADRMQRAAAVRELRAAADA